MKVYEEILAFIAGSPSVAEAANFQASPEARQRLAALIRKQGAESLTPEEELELDDCRQLEHLMRLVQARAQRRLTHS
jgi:hypothetical protein